MIDFFKKYHRWIVAGVSLVGIGIVWLIVQNNKGLRQKLETMMLQLVISNKVADLREKAAVLQTKADTDSANAEAIQAKVAVVQKQIEDNKASLQKGLSDRGLTADEISSRLSSLGQ